MSTVILLPSCIELNSSMDTTIIGIFASAQPDATVRSAFVHIIATGAELLDFNE